MHYNLSIKSQSELSHWELSHIINVFGNTYMKLTILYEMQKLYDSNATDDKFILGSSSLELHTSIHELNNPIHFSSTNEFATIDRKSNNADSFWQQFHKLHRPVIFYKTDNGYKSLYNYENSIIFSAIETNSPQSFKILGKNISIEIAKMVMSSIVGYEVINLVYSNETKLELARMRHQITEISDNQRENSQDIIKTRNLITMNNSLEQTQINILKKDNEKILKILNEIYTEEKTNYNPFIQEQIDVIEERFQNQLEEVKFIVEDFANV